MRLVPWDPDVQTIISRIDSNALDLQPNFQRGEVWPKSKKQRLVDSILRDWHVPPIHVIENHATRKQEVLDGQQRLVAIRDFVRGEFGVDGDIEPIDKKIKALHGMKYHSLPEETKRQFDQFTLRLYKIIDFNPSEPAELFYRLNQPSNLTGAEQRNAFFGPVRDQVRKIVAELEERGIGKNEFGFSNARMAYDDVICRVALTIHRGSIATKITSGDLIELYRQNSPLDEPAYSLIKKSVDLFCESVVSSENKPKFNKATLYTWLIFTTRLLSIETDTKSQRQIVSKSLEVFSDASQRRQAIFTFNSHLSFSDLFKIYEDRASSRVADVSSIVLRDLIVWSVFSELSDQTQRPSRINNIKTQIDKIFNSNAEDPETLARRAVEAGWSDIK